MRKTKAIANECGANFISIKATIILTKKAAPDKLIVDDSATDDHSTIAVDPIKM
jgi:hypothetical protein